MEWILETLLLGCVTTAQSRPNPAGERGSPCSCSLQTCWVGVSREEASLSAVHRVRDPASPRLERQLYSKGVLYFSSCGPFCPLGSHEGNLLHKVTQTFISRTGWTGPHCGPGSAHWFLRQSLGLAWCAAPFISAHQAEKKDMNVFHPETLAPGSYDDSFFVNTAKSTKVL